MIFSFIANLFTTFIYQPFFNLLVLIYYSLGFLPQIPNDMGIAVIVFTLVFRVLWLPITLSSSRKEKDKRLIAKKMREIQITYAKDPVNRKIEEKKIMHANKGLLIATYINIGFQIIIALMLYRIFTKGLEGADFHFLYKFVPQPTEPFNLLFLGKFDLTRPNVILNIYQTMSILLIEILSLAFSPFPAKKKDLTAVFVLPLISFIFFSQMPAGKKLFIIITLAFSITLMLVKRLIYWYHTVNNKVEGWVNSQAEKQAKAKKSSGI